jgi:hypothetical protein
MRLLFTDAVTFAPGTPEPTEAFRPITPWRRGVAVRGDAVFLDGHAVRFDPDAPGVALDALLDLAHPGVLRRLPEAERTALRGTCQGIVTSWTAADGLAGVRRMGARCAAAAVLRGLDHPVDLDADGLLGALLAADPDVEQETMREWADWLLSADPSYTLQEDRYELTRTDVGLLWCGLARAATSDAVTWLRSGLVIFHECRPVGQQISDPARRAWLGLLAETPERTDYLDWQDRIVAVLDSVRGAALERRAPAAGIPRQQAHPLVLSDAQRRELGPDHADFLDEAATWFDDARRSGALPPTAFRAVLRVRDDPGAVAAERVLGAAVGAAYPAIVGGDWQGQSLSGDLAAALLVVLLEQVDHVDDLDALLDAVRAGLTPAQLGSFTEPWTAVPWWRMLGRWVRFGREGWGAHPATLQDAGDATLYADLLADLAVHGLGPATGTHTLGLRDTATLVHAVAVDGRVVDTNGRRVVAAGSGLPGRLERGRLSIPDLPGARLDLGDTVLLPQGRAGVLSEVRADGALVAVVEDGHTRYRPVALADLEAPSARSRWAQRSRLASIRRRLERPFF